MSNEHIWDGIRFPSGEDGIHIYKMLIGGEWIESGNKKTFDVKSPATGNTIARVQKATRDDAEKIIESAYNAKKEMAKLSGVEKSAMLRKAADIIREHEHFFTEVLVEESGKPFKTAEGEVKAAIERIEYAAEECKYVFGDEMDGHMSPHKKGKIGLLFRQPLGVVLAISSFNFPLNIPVLKVAPALAAGNSVILKPASDDPLSAILLIRVLEKAGFPKGAVNIITGSGGEVGDPMAESEKVDMISFTGSTGIGKHVSKISGMKKLHMELGGKCPAIVLSDSDLEKAAKECIKGSITYAGQRCDAISRILVEESVADTFVEMLNSEMANWKMGDPMDPSVTIGPVINKGSFDFIMELVEDAKKKGAKVIRGGKTDGLFIDPVLLDHVTEDMRIAWEETFGPALPIIRVKDYEHAIELANRSEYGLDSCIFTQDIDKAMDAGLRIESGTVSINTSPSHGIGFFPFGGDKNSGIGREGVRESIKEMTKPHVVIMKINS